jgi:hypothetical protein
MNARTAIAATITLASLLALAAHATTPSGDGAAYQPTPAAKRLPQTHSATHTPKPSDDSARASAVHVSPPYIITSATIRRND